MTGSFLRKNSVTDNNCQPMASKTTYESRLQDFIIEGIEDEIDVNQILDDLQPKNESTMNIGGNDNDDHFTVNTEVLVSHCLILHWICMKLLRKKLLMVLSYSNIG